MVSIFKNESGVSSFKVFIIILLLFAVIHTGFKLIPMYMGFQAMQDDMEAKARAAQVLKDQEILYELSTKAKEEGLPLKAESFVIQRDEDNHTMTISTKWDVEVHFLFDVYVRTFHFEPVVSADYSKIGS